MWGEGQGEYCLTMVFVLGTVLQVDFLVNEAVSGLLWFETACSPELLV